MTTSQKTRQPIEQLSTEYEVKFVDILTCGELYSKLAIKKSLYKSAPAEGLALTVEYGDTLGFLDDNGHEIDTSSPVVLCLHGAPGSHLGYAKLISHLKKTGARVIAPNFPTYELTAKCRVFRHSGQEKKEYVKDFLKAIGIDRIDLLVSHSSAIYPTTLLWRDEQCPPIRSIAFLNPSGHRRIKAMRPKILTSVFVRVYQNKLGRDICRSFGTTVLSITGCPVRPDNMDNVILSATTMVYSKFRYLTKSLEMLREKRVPILFILSENDKLVDTEISYEMASILGAQEDQYSIYNQYSVLEKVRPSTAYPWVIVLPEGGHYSFVNHPKVVNEAISSFVSSLNNNCLADSDSSDTNLNCPTNTRTDVDCTVSQ